MTKLPRLHFDLQRHTLDNGLRVVLHRDPRLPLVAINLWYHVGSKNEAAGETGFAHLFEHLLFQGSKNVGTNDHFRYVQEVGGVANGSTWYDRTNYYETLPSHHLDRGLWLESDRMGFFLQAITQENLDNQREVVINERRQRMDNQPYGCAFERLNQLLFPEDHPYRSPVIGYIPDLEAANLDTVRRFFTTFYVPNNAVLTLAGDIDYDDAIQRVEKYFGDIPAGAAVPRPQVPPVGLKTAQRAILEDDVKLPRIYLGFQAPPYGDDQWYAGELLVNALSAGKSSPVYEDLVYQQRLAQDVGAFIGSTQESSTFIMVATAKPNVDVDQLEAAMRRHLQTAAEQTLAKEHVDRARNRLLTAYYNDLQTLERRADLLSHFTVFFDDPGGVAREVERYTTVTDRDLQTFAAKFLQPEQSAMVTVVPHPEAKS